MADDMRSRNVVDGWRRHVHHEYGECDAIGERAPFANGENEEADTATVYETTLRARRSRYRICRDKKRAQDRCARKQVEARARIGAR